MKKLFLCALLPLCTYASDSQKKTEKEDYSPLAEYLTECNNTDKFGGQIWPSSFQEHGKDAMRKYIAVWVAAIKEDVDMPGDRGLAKMFLDMERDGVEAIVNDENALKKANEYLHDYEKSPSYEIEQIIKRQLNPGQGGNYYFPGAAESNTDRLRITRQHEFTNIMYKRHEAPIMPQTNLVSFYYDQSTKSALEILRLNIDNTKLSSKAIRGITLLAIYQNQKDKK